MASLNSSHDNDVKNFLIELQLESYYEKFIEEGFDDINFFGGIQMEDLLDIGMRRGHARRVISKINQTFIPNNTSVSEDIDNLPIAHEVYRVETDGTVGSVPHAATSPSSFDFNSMKKEMQQQMEVDFNARLDERLAEERIARERMEQEQIATLTDERAAMKKEIERERIAAETQLRQEIKQNEEARQATNRGETKNVSWKIIYMYQSEFLV